MPQPTLIQLLQTALGDSAPPPDDPTACLWAEAFDAWLDYQYQSSTTAPKIREKTRRHTLQSWADLLQTAACPPWSIEARHIAAWIDRLQAHPYRAATIDRKLCHISTFYEYLIAHRPGFASLANPTRAVTRPPYEAKPANILSPHETQALLTAIDKEASLLGLRDYALLLAHLHTPLTSGEIRHLRWGDLQRDNRGHWTVQRARSTDMLVALDPRVRHAIAAYLQASGRLETIQDQDVIFAPSADRNQPPRPDHPQDWVPDRPLSCKTVHWMLKRYAAWAGLDHRRITTYTLRDTALARCLETGATPSQTLAAFGYAFPVAQQAPIKRRLFAARKSFWKPNSRYATRLSQIKPYERRSVGAPHGNSNRWKGGLPYFSIDPHEIRETLDLILSSEIDPLASEIAVLRVMALRAFEAADKIRDPYMQVLTYARIGDMLVKIGRLYRMRKQRGDLQMPLTPGLLRMFENISADIQGDEPEN